MVDGVVLISLSNSLIRLSLMVQLVDNSSIGWTEVGGHSEDEYRLATKKIGSIGPLSDVTSSDKCSRMSQLSTKIKVIRALYPHFFTNHYGMLYAYSLH